MSRRWPNGRDRDYDQMSLQDRIATPDAKRRHVRALFATIADRYDFITVLLSYGRDRHWKEQLIGLAAPGPGRARSISRPARATSRSRWPGASRGSSASTSRSG